MTSPEENVAVVREALDDFGRGDLEVFLNFLDPDVEIFSPPELPNPIHAKGRDAYLEWTSHWFEAWENFEVEAEEFEAMGERHVLMPVVQRGVGKGSGVEVEMHACYMIEVRDGLAARMFLYADRAGALAAAEAGEAG
jgi:ketosteroid isomerase-like protein